MKEKESACVVYVCASAYKGQKRRLDPLEVELQAFVSHLAFVVGFEL